MNVHDAIVLTDAVPECGLVPGDVGAIVHVYDAGDSFEAEFVGGDGRTLAQLTLRRDQIRPIAGGEILHIRRVPA